MKIAGHGNMSCFESFSGRMRLSCLWVFHWMRNKINTSLFGTILKMVSSQWKMPIILWKNNLQIARCSFKGVMVLWMIFGSTCGNSKCQVKIFLLQICKAIPPTTSKLIVVKFILIPFALYARSLLKMLIIFSCAVQ